MIFRALLGPCNFLLWILIFQANAFIVFVSQKQTKTVHNTCPKRSNHLLQNAKVPKFSLMTFRSCLALGNLTKDIHKITYKNSVQNDVMPWLRVWVTDWPSECMCSWGEGGHWEEYLARCILKWVLASLMLGVTLRWWTSIASKGKKKYSKLLDDTETGISSGLMSLKARTLTKPFFTFWEVIKLFSRNFKHQIDFERAIKPSTSFSRW